MIPSTRSSDAVVMCSTSRYTGSTLLARQSNSSLSHAVRMGDGGSQARRRRLRERGWRRRATVYLALGSNLMATIQLCTNTHEMVTRPAPGAGCRAFQQARSEDAFHNAVRLRLSIERVLKEMVAYCSAVSRLAGPHRLSRASVTDTVCMLCVVCALW